MRQTQNTNQTIKPFVSLLPRFKKIEKNKPGEAL